ncbi:thermonuclease family protein [Porphyrobacter sp. CACIAM 03H1]|uniref:thermonuclease family protein n=1 Tax=Porphyrobacter sp. CACIAM 03H1 TaxID=2003315 RepID=UPI000B5A51C3|nr:thermonuclease family protein [Porphyrobacter sp. CACIAM 03H1]ASJ90091.1 nuclease [Porphyrobacter sp. CACIAM 03H1]
MTRPAPFRRRWLALAAAPLAALGALALWPEAGEAQDSEGRGEPHRALFPVCSGPVRVTCVVDGDTIWYRGTKIRIADIDTPEIARPGCPQERALGERATERLRQLLNAGGFALETPPGGRTRDRYGRELRIVTRGGQSIGAVLVREGLATRWGGPRRRWCGA